MLLRSAKSIDEQLFVDFAIHVEPPADLERTLCSDDDIDGGGIVQELLSDVENDNDPETTQPIPEADPLQSIQSQLKDKWIEQIRKESDIRPTAPYVCGRCQEYLDDKPKHIGCEGPCDKWFHSDCVDITDADFQ